MMRGPRFAGLFAATLVATAAAGAAAPPSQESACAACHKESSPGLYRQWAESRHAASGVDCLACHRAEATEPDAFAHHGFTIATLVTPKDCGACHEQEAADVGRSYHATAGQILDSQDAYLAHVTAGNPVAVIGCESCHGGKVKLDPDSPNKLHRDSWPNSGIGRINPDGSLGACNACHTRHNFSKAQARQPEACGKCHLGPDHPQKEIYDESKHGNTYYTNEDQMNLKSDSWVVGVDYSVAPTCATCHMAATRHQASTHDVGQRIAWTLRPPESSRKDNWQAKRQNMREMCSACHQNGFVDGHFSQYDATVRLYNERFARPATEIINLARARKLLAKEASFSNEIEWIYWELWHHEGRRARHGAAMMGPDYTWWHGFYEVAHSFYFKLIPAARELDDPEVNALIERILTQDPMHAWMRKSTDDLKRQIRSGEMQEIYRRFFSEG
jgi:hydroxylamine dehydrogenase